MVRGEKPSNTATAGRFADGSALLSRQSVPVESRSDAHSDLQIVVFRVSAHGSQRLACELESAYLACRFCTGAHHCKKSAPDETAIKARNRPSSLLKPNLLNSLPTHAGAPTR